MRADTFATHRNGAVMACNALHRPSSVLIIPGVTANTDNAASLPPFPPPPSAVLASCPGPDGIDVIDGIAGIDNNAASCFVNRMFACFEFAYAPKVVYPDADDSDATTPGSSVTRCTLSAAVPLLMLPLPSPPPPLPPPRSSSSRNGASCALCSNRELTVTIRPTVVSVLLRRSAGRRPKQQSTPRHQARVSNC